MSRRSQHIEFDIEVDNEVDLAKESASESRSLLPGQCVFCNRVMKNGTTEHHLIPRTCHRNRWFQKRFTRIQMRQTVAACRDCHSAIHRFVPREKDLGRSFNTIELLMGYEEFSKFVDWISRQK
ncbi:MAG: hypothetical protein ACI87E_004992 [Mariniblastus sp.]